MNCKDKGYKVGQIFKATKKAIAEGFFDPAIGSDDLLQLESDRGRFRVISGKYFGRTQSNSNLDRVSRVWPPEAVSISLNGVETEISIESAKALKECLKDI